jgi:hypothetical protein
MVEEAIECLHELESGAVVTHYDEESVTIDLLEITGKRLHLTETIQHVKNLGRQSRRNRNDIYFAFWAQYFRFLAEDGPLTVEDRGRILPVLVQPKRLEDLADGTSLGLIPNRPFYETGFLVSYMMRVSDSVKLLRLDDAAQLELDELGLFEIAMGLAANKYPREAFRSLLPNSGDGGGPVRMSECEEYENSMLLMLAPQYLDEHEEYAVILAGYLVMIWGVAPTDNTWNEWREIAKEGDDPFFGRPFRVNSGGVWLM